MQIDYTQIVTKYDGKTVFTNEQDHPLTLGEALIKSTDIACPSDNGRGPLGRYQVGEMGVTILKGGELTPEQLATLRDRCQEAFLMPSLVYALTRLINGLLDSGTQAAVPTEPS